MKPLLCKLCQQLDLSGKLGWLPYAGEDKTVAFPDVVEIVQLAARGMLFLSLWTQQKQAYKAGKSLSKETAGFFIHIMQACLLHMGTYLTPTYATQPDCRMVAAVT